MASFEYTGNEFADQAIRAIISQQLPFYGEKPRQFLGFSVRYAVLEAYRPYKIVQPAGHTWLVYRRGDRTMSASALARIIKRGEAYVIAGTYVVDETRIEFGPALLLALDYAALIAKVRNC